MTWVKPATSSTSKVSLFEVTDDVRLMNQPCKVKDLALEFTVWNDLNIEPVSRRFDGSVVSNEWSNGPTSRRNEANGWGIPAGGRERLSRTNIAQWFRDGEVNNLPRLYKGSEVMAV